MWLIGKSFNKVVRSHEALIMGLLVGVICGVILMLNVTILVKDDNLKVPIKLCDSAKNVASANYSYTGQIKKVLCKDKRVFNNF